MGWTFLVVVVTGGSVGSSLLKTIYIMIIVIVLIIMIVTVMIVLIIMIFVILVIVLIVMTNVIRDAALWKNRKIFPNGGGG